MMKRRVNFQRAGFTLMELLLTMGIVSILMSVIIGAINPGKRIGSARDAVRKNDLQALARAIQAYWVEKGEQLPGNRGQVYSSDKDGQPTPQDASGNGWINGTNLSAQMKTLPVDPLNTANFHYSYYADPSSSKSDLFKVYTKMEADQDAAEKDDGAALDLYEAGTGKTLVAPSY